MTKKKKFKTKGKKLNAVQLRAEVFKLFKRHPKKRLNAKQIIKKLKIANSKDAVNDALAKLAKDEKLFQLDDFKFRLDRKARKNTETSIHIGKVDMTRTGAAYIVCEGLKDDVYVPTKYINGAMNGDKVEVKVFVPRGRRKPEGEIVKVLERSAEQFIGSLNITRKYGVVTPDKLNIPFEIFVNLDELNGAKDGDKVIVKVTKWPTRQGHNPMGVVTMTLGAMGGNDIEMKAILINNGFNLLFPKEVVAESEALSKEIDEAEVARRRDMRAVTTFTIDPDTAKDFDDALSIQYLEGGEIEIGVHIADVSHYVKPGTALDKEAYLRSTSVYLVDRVLPMLPEELSNGLCSLRPNEDKCTFSAVFVFDKNDKVKSRWFGKTLTHSNRRFTYEEAQEIIENGEGEFAEEIKVMNRIAKKLRKAKFKNGAIAFESEEVKFRLDEDGVPIEAYVKERKEAHMLIEDFMLLANREVATYISKRANGQEIPFVYRVHDLPNMEKVADFALFAKAMGVNMNIDTPRNIANSFNELSKAARTNDVLRMLEPIAIRTMAKAAYTSNNIGHYGLGFEFYSHFTSPIRRYSDVLVHRLLEKNLKDTFRTDKAKLEEKCKHISAMERKAMEAERESIKYKQVEYIEKRIGEEFDGRISGMIDRGLFVELVDNKCEGMLGFDQFDEPFEIADSRLYATGLRSKTVYKMGDTIRVKIIAADLSRRQIEMALVVGDHNEEE